MRLTSLGGKIVGPSFQTTLETTLQATLKEADQPFLSITSLPLVSTDRESEFQ
jgi:hypothetical protein